jgi:hypothetical protein
MTALDIATSYIGRGWNPLPLPFRAKKPVDDGWQTRVIGDADVSTYFKGEPMNIGVVLGPSSRGLVDIDLDCDEAITVAPAILPPTKAIFGRASARASHRLYYHPTLAATLSQAVLQLKDPRTKDVLLEVRVGPGAQSVFPGSTHKDTGEAITWEEEGEPAQASDDLITRSKLTAALCLMARYWPPPNTSRHEAALTIGGFLARCGFNPPMVRLCAEFVARAAHDEEVGDRARAAYDAAIAHDKGEKTRGYPALKELYEDKIASKIAEWIVHSEPRVDGPEGLGVALDDFYAVMPMHTYIYVPSREMWPAASVNARIAPVLCDNKPIPANQWLDKRRPVEQLTWMPGLPMVIPNKLVAESGWIERLGVSCFNLYRPPTIEHGNAANAGPWVDHVRLVYGDDADHIVMWLAHRVQRPQEKVNHALVLGGPQGIGKDTLLEPVKYAVGPWNVAEVSPQQMLGRFNGFIKSVILRISEARDLGDSDRYKFYDHLKVLTAAPPDVMRADEKNLREHNVPNVTGVIITSNNKTDGIYLPADDRRHFVAWSPLSKDDFPDGYWNRLYGWYRSGGFENVAAYLATLDISAFDAKAPPPKTAVFWEIVDANRAPEDAELADALEAMGWPDATTLERIAYRAEAETAIWLRDRKNRRSIGHRLDHCGYVQVRNPDAQSDGLWRVSGKRQAVYTKAKLVLRDRIAAARHLAR